MGGRQTVKRPCFFCGTENVFVRTQVHYGTWRFVECPGCGARGPRLKEAVDAARTWNSGEQRKFPDRKIRLIAQKPRLVLAQEYPATP